MAPSITASPGEPCLSCVVHVVPALPPKVSGVGDYAVTLAGTLERHECGSRLITASGGCAEVGGLPVARLRGGDAQSLVGVLKDARRIVLHFSGYEYARWGLCFWLANGISRWRVESAERRLVTVFHELFATGPAWRTSFWTSPPQRRIAHRVARFSDAMITNSAGNAAQLKLWEPQKRSETMPVFSNVGELATPVPLAYRAPMGVVFGGRRRVGTWRSLEAASATAAAALRARGITQILDIGPELEAVPDHLDGLPIRAAGTLPAGEVSAQLARARIGIADYPRHVMTKSGIVAAYLAHGLLCVNTSEVGQLPDDLGEGREFVSLRRLSCADVDMDMVAAAGHAWYRRHDVAATAALVHELIA